MLGTVEHVLYRKMHNLLCYGLPLDSLYRCAIISVESDLDDSVMESEYAQIHPIPGAKQVSTGSSLTPIIPISTIV